MNASELLRAFTADRDDIACPRCGYSLRDLQSPHCPECGDALELQVALVEPRMGPYLALVLAPALGAGASGLLGLLALFQAPARFWVSASGILLLSLFVLSVPALAALVLGRRHVRRLGPKATLLLAAAAWLVVVALSAGILGWFDA